MDIRIKTRFVLHLAVTLCLIWALFTLAGGAGIPDWLLKFIRLISLILMVSGIASALFRGRAIHPAVSIYVLALLIVSLVRIFGFPVREDALIGSLFVIPALIVLYFAGHSTGKSMVLLLIWGLLWLLWGVSILFWPIAFRGYDTVSVAVRTLPVVPALVVSRESGDVLFSFVPMFLRRV